MQPFLAPLSKAEEKQYIKALSAGDKNARNKLIEKNIRLVAHVVKKYVNTYTEQEDLLDIGVVGLLKAVDTYDETKGNHLATYAVRCIENEILMQLRQERKISREVSIYEPLGKDKDGNETNLMDMLESATPDVLETIEKREQLGKIPEFMKQALTGREQELIRLRYGLFGEEVHTQKEVGALFGISRSYVSRMEKKALKKLRQCYEAQ